jgi:hypothetical protein
MRLPEGHRPGGHLRQPLQRPGIPARRQVQHRIPREQRRHAPDPGPVTDPRHGHLTQPGHHRAGMTTLAAGPPHPVGTGHPRQPDLPLSLPVQRQLDQPAQQLPAPLPDQPLHRIQRHRPPRIRSQPGQQDRQRPQPRHHRLRARRQLIQPVLFHLRLPFRSPGLRTSGPYGTEASPIPEHAADPRKTHSKRAAPMFHRAAGRRMDAPSTRSRTGLTPAVPPGLLGFGEGAGGYQGADGAEGYGQGGEGEALALPDLAEGLGGHRHR